jgi:CheY-like chemotaxis protein
MDYSMPVMNGIEASRCIKELYEAKKIKSLPYICALTGYSSE